VSLDKPFHIEVTIDAPLDVVWRELTQPERIKHWFGWDYDGLDGEIEHIFVEHAELHPPNRIELGMEQTIRLDAVDKYVTRVTVTKPGDLDALEWKDVYGDIEEGWILFFQQLRHRLLVDPVAPRRTILREGPARLEDLPGTPWHASAFQRGFDEDGTLAVLGVKPGAEGRLVVTTYGLDDATFAAAEARWDEVWKFVART
jgi:uncharacterized protein YndB with AHSA1/START domain